MTSGPTDCSDGCRHSACSCIVVPDMAGIATKAWNDFDGLGGAAVIGNQKERRLALSGWRQRVLEVKAL